MRLAWPEKITLALFALITLVMLFLGSGATPDMSEYCRSLRLEHPAWTHADSYCFVTGAQHWAAFAWIEGFLLLKIMLPAWIVARLVDLFGGGPALRRGDRERQHSAAPDTAAHIDLGPGEWTSC